MNTVKIKNPIVLYQDFEISTNNEYLNEISKDEFLSHEDVQQQLTKSQKFLSIDTLFYKDIQETLKQQTNLKLSDIENNKWYQLKNTITTPQNKFTGLVVYEINLTNHERWFLNEFQIHRIFGQLIKYDEKPVFKHQIQLVCDLETECKLVEFEPVRSFNSSWWIIKIPVKLSQILYRIDTNVAKTAHNPVRQSTKIYLPYQAMLMSYLKPLEGSVRRNNVF